MNKVYLIFFFIITILGYTITSVWVGTKEYNVYGYLNLSEDVPENNPAKVVTTPRVLGSPDWTSNELSSKYFEAKKPLLINEKNPVPYDYVLELKQWTEEIELDSRAYLAFSDMWTAAKEQGESLWIISGYRSDESQKNNFDKLLEEHKKSGLDENQAYKETLRTIATVGHSEHSTGLAIDLNLISTDFELHSAYKWLEKNAASYGFILRYPKNKENITGHSFEPWHYRYVGSNHATRMYEKGLTLEEYLLDENYYR